MATMARMARIVLTTIRTSVMIRLRFECDGAPAAGESAVLIPI
jgi:hypothetical protein